MSKSHSPFRRISTKWIRWFARINSLMDIFMLSFQNIYHMNALLDPTGDLWINWLFGNVWDFINVLFFIFCLANSHLGSLLLRAISSTNSGIIALASCQIRKIAYCTCAGNAGNVFPRRRLQRKPLVNDPDMHHGTCRDACRYRLPAGKTFRAFLAHAHPQFYVSGKRPMEK